ncbi:serine/threonine-protein kinase [Chondromyces crocatus]|uniref:Protein kinase n=1 Tax=Chondromyces crocatus TaxID=52 RepID=A0A0K1EBB9_CHOCO|nr:serine/threonine-protein kinase [Chondromyces crocatus]AKT37878.1 protein kinase [Chondromyces crocatus]
MRRVFNPTSPAQQLVGAVLNSRWRLARLVGEGGMGAVYEADGVRGEGKRAIKILHPEFSEDEQILQRFFTEAQAMQALSHPNIAAAQEAARAEDGTPYLVMELLQGASLGAYLEQGTPMAPQQTVALVVEVLQALAMAHARGIVHRDLKPDNLFLVRDPHGNLHAKVLDFGIAKVMDAAGGMGSKTRTGVLLGTPGYMSPEQIKNSKGVDARSDLWSMGIILYEMLTCQTPYPADNEFGRLTVVLTNDARPIEQVAPHLSAWAPFFRRALAKEASQRFQSAEEMAQALLAMVRPASMAPPPLDRGPSMPIPMQSPAAAHAQAHVQAHAQRYSSVAPTAVVPGLAQPSYVPPQPVVTLPSGAGPVPTHVSGQMAPGAHGYSMAPPVVQVISPTSAQPTAGFPLWVVIVVGVAGLGLGFLLGALVAG